VTGLDSREDRERGIAAGADAYIVKTNFDQSNLLDVVQRLL
jgi:two-component system, chemotaxis family, sensor kinase CheA